MMSTQISQQHLTRDACIYIRQSSMTQVCLNQESTRRQYDLKHKALGLGWDPERIRILDRDLGQSGAHAVDRADFKVLVSDVAMGRVGAIFALEASRFARSNLDWLRLLELCAITNTLVVDEDGCYNPADFNDGLVLGLKGTFAQAELHIIRARLLGGKLKKASRGELRFYLPVGLVYDEVGRTVLDPDQEVQGAVRMVFDLFEREGSAYAVTQRFRELGLRFPRRSWGGVWDGRLIWGRLTYSRLTRLLINPAYAGAYVFGRQQSYKAVGPDGEIKQRTRFVRPEDGKVFLVNHHQGYITWEQFLANRKKLSENRTWTEDRMLPGPVREGLCLLQGILICSVCGRRMSSRYTGNGGIYPMYGCNWEGHKPGKRCCLTVSAGPLDRAISDRLVSAITPVTIELALKALESLEERDKEVAAQWWRRIERARYEADLAERRYEAVDPANRLVAVTLEQRWNEAMQRLHELEAEIAEFERQKLRAVTPEQKQRIRQLATEFPKLWQAETTTPRDRKRLLRLMIRDITITKVLENQKLHMDVRWQGGATERLTIDLPRKRQDAIRYPAPFIARIRTLATTLEDQQIADLLTDEGLVSSTGKPFTVQIIQATRYTYRIPGPPLPPGAFTVRQLAERYGITQNGVLYWIKAGIIHARPCQRHGRPHIVEITDEIDQALRARATKSSKSTYSSTLKNEV